MPTPRRRGWSALAALACVLAAACGGGGDDDTSDATTTDAPATTGAPATVEITQASIPPADPTVVDTVATTPPETDAPATTEAAIAEGVIGPDGGEVTSDDGSATLEIPPGALADPVAVEIVAADVDLGVPGDPIAGYSLRPDDLDFAQPATMHVTLPVDDGLLRAIPTFAILSRDGEAPEGIAADVVATADATIASFPIEHFSAVGVYVLEAGRTESTVVRFRTRTMNLSPSRVELAPGATFHPKTVACCISEVDDEEPDGDVIVFAFGVPATLPVEESTISDFQQLVPGGILVEGEANVVPGRHRTVDLYGEYTCTQPGTDFFGSRATFTTTYTSPVETVRDRATLTVKGTAFCEGPDALPRIDGQVFPQEAFVTVEEQPDGSTVDVAPTAEDLAVGHPEGGAVVRIEADGSPQTYGVYVSRDGSMLRAATCLASLVGTSSTDNERLVAESPPGACPDDAITDPATQASPVEPTCAASGPAGSVILTPLPVRDDGVVVLTFGVSVAENRLLQGGGPVGAVDAAEIPMLEIDPGRFCAGLATTEGVLDFLDAPPPDPEPAGVLECVQARYDDTGRLASFPASLLLFIRAFEPMTAARGLIVGANNDQVQNGYADAGGFWIEAGVPGPGEYTISDVVIVTAAGETNVTAEVIEALDGATLIATTPGVISRPEACE